MKINEIIIEAVKQRLDAKCWKGKHKEGTKIKGGVRVNNCVPNESLQEFALSDKDRGDDGDGEGFPRRQPKFKQGDVVWIEANPPKHRSHFASNCPAIVIDCSPKESDHDDIVYPSLDKHMNSDDIEYWINSAREEAARQPEYGLIALQKGDVYKSWWYNEDNLILIPKGTDPVKLCSKGNTESYDQLPAKVKSLLNRGLGQEDMTETAAWQKKAGKNKTGGLNQKGVDSYRKEHPGSKLQTAVTTKPSKLKAGSKDAKRRKSFCARMSGMKGPMKDEHGKSTRKALALKKWNC